MMRLATIACAVVLLPGGGFSSPADDGHGSAIQPAIKTATQGAAVIRPPATETLRGIVETVDQGNDSITIRLSSKATAQFKVQDGLIFNAVRFGDAVQVSVQDINGFRTIVALSER